MSDRAVLLGHPQPDIGAAGQQRRRDAAASTWASAALLRGARQRVPARHRHVAAAFRSSRAGPPSRASAAENWSSRPASYMRSAGGDDRLVAGAAAQVAGQRIVDFGAPTARGRAVQREHRHDETGRAEAHCEPWQSTIACCTGCSAPSADFQDSTVNSALPSRVGRNWMQALTGAIAQGRRHRVRRSPRCRRRNHLRRSLPCGRRGRRSQRAGTSTAARDRRRAKPACRPR